MKMPNPMEMYANIMKSYSKMFFMWSKMLAGDYKTTSKPLDLHGHQLYVKGQYNDDGDYIPGHHVTDIN